MRGGSGTDFERSRSLEVERWGACCFLEVLLVLEDVFCVGRCSWRGGGLALYSGVCCDRVICRLSRVSQWLGSIVHVSDKYVTTGTPGSKS